MPIPENDFTLLPFLEGMKAGCLQQSEPNTDQIRSSLIEETTNDQAPLISEDHSLKKRKKNWFSFITRLLGIKHASVDKLHTLAKNIPEIKKSLDELTHSSIIDNHFIAVSKHQKWHAKVKKEAQKLWKSSQTKSIFKQLWHGLTFWHKRKIKDFHDRLEKADKKLIQHLNKAQQNTPEMRTLARRTLGYYLGKELAESPEAGKHCLDQLKERSRANSINSADIDPKQIFDQDIKELEQFSCDARMDLWSAYRTKDALTQKSEEHLKQLSDKKKELILNKYHPDKIKDTPLAFKVGSLNKKFNLIKKEISDECNFLNRLSRKNYERQKQNKIKEFKAEKVRITAKSADSQEEEVMTPEQQTAAEIEEIRAQQERIAEGIAELERKHIEDREKLKQEIMEAVRQDMYDIVNEALGGSGITTEKLHDITSTSSKKNEADSPSYFVTSASITKSQTQMINDATALSTSDSASTSKVNSGNQSPSPSPAPPSIAGSPHSFVAHLAAHNSIASVNPKVISADSDAVIQLNDSSKPITITCS